MSIVLTTSCWELVSINFSYFLQQLLVNNKIEMNKTKIIAIIYRPNGNIDINGINVCHIYLYVYIYIYIYTYSIVS